jgi:hypothetical protein
MTITNLEKVYDTYQYLNYDTSWGFAFTTGEVNKSLGRASFTANFHNQVWAEFASAFGYNNNINLKAHASFVTGQSNIADAPYAFIANMGNTVEATTGAAFGYNNNVSADSGFVTGKENKVKTAFGSVIGEYNLYGKLGNKSPWDVAQEGDTGEPWKTNIYDSTNPDKQIIASLAMIPGGDDYGDTDTIFAVGAGVTDSLRHTAFRIKKDSTIEHRIRFGYSNAGSLIRKKVFKTDKTGHIKIYEAPTEDLHPVRYKELLALKSTFESALANLEDAIRLRLERGGL